MCGDQHCRRGREEGRERTHQFTGRNKIREFPPKLTCSAQVAGPPVAARTEDAGEERLVRGVAGAAARLTVVFCSQPGPATVTWHWPGQQLPAGAELDRRSVTQ